MKVAAINSYQLHNHSKLCAAKNSQNSYKNSLSVNDNVTFEGKAGKVLGGLLGGAAGGAAGGAIIGGGTLAGMAALAALGPLGIAAAAAYTIGGALAGGYVGSTIADAVEDKKKGK